MDYKGNYFKDDDEDLSPFPSKNAKRIKKAFKILLYSISFLVYGMIFFAIFTSCEPGMFSKMHFSDSARQKASDLALDFEVYGVHPTDFMNYDGSIQLRHLFYAESANELEIGIQFNKKKITDGETQQALACILSDSDGNFYLLANEVTGSNRKYGYLRVSFGVETIVIKDNYYYDYIFFDINNFNNRDKDDTPHSKGVEYTLAIYDYKKLSDKGIVFSDTKNIYEVDFASLKEAKVEPITSFVVYNNNTRISESQYQK